MPGVGLQLLPMTAPESSPWGSSPFPQPCSATLPAAERETACFAFGRRPCRHRVGSQCSSGRLGVWPCGSLQALSIIPRVLQARCFVWTGARMTSVEHVAGMLQMCLGIIRAWLGLGWAGAWAFRENQALATKDGGRAGQVLTKNGPGPRTVTDPRRALYLQLQQTPAGYKYLLGSCCTSSHRNRSHNHSME